MTTHDLAHGIRALEREIAARTLSGATGLVPLARAAGQMRRELAARGRDALLVVGCSTRGPSWFERQYVRGPTPYGLAPGPRPEPNAQGDWVAVVGNPPWPVAR